MLILIGIVNFVVNIVVGCCYILVVNIVCVNYVVSVVVVDIVGTCWYC